MINETIRILSGVYYNWLVFIFALRYVNKDVNNKLIHYDNKLVIANHTMSMGHCVLISLMSLSHIVYGYDFYINSIKYYSIGFLINDMYVMNKYKVLSNQKYLYTIHHLMFISTWYYYHEYKSLYFRLLLSEISVIPMNLKILSKFYFPNKKIYLSLTIWITFLLTRIINSTHILWNNNFVVRKFPIISIIYMSLQYYWFTLMTIKGFNTVNSYYYKM